MNKKIEGWYMFYEACEYVWKYKTKRLSEISNKEANFGKILSDIFDKYLGADIRFTVDKHDDSILLHAKLQTYDMCYEGVGLCIAYTDGSIQVNEFLADRFEKIYDLCRFKIFDLNVEYEEREKQEISRKEKDDYQKLQRILPTLEAEE